MLRVMLEVANSSGISVNQYTWHNIPEDSHFYAHSHNNLKSHPLFPTLPVPAACVLKH
jgi:hypothetical protein